MTTTINKDHIMFSMFTNMGKNLGEQSFNQPILLIFLRHFGCAFCRASMIELSKNRAEYENTGAQIVLVHMSENDLAELYFKKYNLTGLEHVSDPQCMYYAAFGLTKGTFNQLLGFSSLVKGFQYAFKKDVGWGPFIGDGFQMPGVFILKDGEIINQFIHKTASDVPDYDSLLACCVNE
jgi:peroxiredoxin